MRKVAYYALLPLMVLWIALALGIMRLGDGLRWLGNAMTGFRADKSIGSAYIE